MNRKLPRDAFEQYIGLGEGRSYSAIAERLGVTKRCVTKRAVQERWSERLTKIQADVRVISDKQITSNLAEMNERHMKVVRLMAARSLEGLRNYPMTSAMEAVRAGDLAVKLERLIAGELPESGAISIEELHRQEIRMLLEVVPTKGTPQVLAAQVSSDAGAG